ncbi:MAG: ATP-binding cassette domain-containing protein, partial [Chloroflexi bacterium]
MTMLRVRDLTVRFGGIVALDGVSLDLNRGEILGLIGPNGAGKTTLFNCISGVIRPEGGSVFFETNDLTYAPPHERARLGVARTFQNLQLWGSMTVEENLMVPERARAILHVLDLGRYARTLAGDLPAGIQRRVEIARALAMRPKLLLLDEPAAGLDAQETARLAELLHAVRERFHVSMLLVDHDMSLVMRVCDFVYVLDFGKLLARGRPDSIRNDPKVIAAYLGEESKKLTGDVATLARARKDEPPLLEVDRLAAGYGGLEVIRDVTLSVRPG